MTYEINNNTVALIFNNNVTKVYEVDNELVINNIPNNIIKFSCEYFGSSYEGRVKGTNSMTGLTHKVPIIIEDSNEIVFFPTSSSRLKNCSWIRSKYIKKYEKYAENKVKITIVNDKEIVINCSYETINNQILRSSRLESLIRYRKV